MKRIPMLLAASLAALSLSSARAEEATPAFYAPAFGPLQPACALAVRLELGRGATCCARTNGPFRVGFRSTECPPVSFDAADAFFSGRADALDTASFTLTRA